MASFNPRKGNLDAIRNGFDGSITQQFQSHRKHWNAIRGRLSSFGFTIVQNGDREGAAVFLPSDPEQARAAIKAAGVKHKRQLSPAQVDRQISWLRASAGRAL